MMRAITSGKSAKSIRRRHGETDEPKSNCKNCGLRYPTYLKEVQ